MSVQQSENFWLIIEMYDFIGDCVNAIYRMINKNLIEMSA